MNDTATTASLKRGKVSTNIPVGHALAYLVPEPLGEIELSAGLLWQHAEASYDRGKCGYDQHPDEDRNHQLHPTSDEPFSGRKLKVPDGRVAQTQLCKFPCNSRPSNPWRTRLLFAQCGVRSPRPGLICLVRQAYKSEDPRRQSSSKLSGRGHRRT